MTEVCPEQKKEAIHPHNSSPDFRQCAFSLAHPHKVSFPPRSVTVDASSYFPPSLPNTMNPQHSTRNPVHTLSANPPETFPPPAPLLNFEAFPFYLSFFFCPFSLFRNALSFPPSSSCDSCPLCFESARQDCLSFFVICPQRAAAYEFGGR